MKLAVIREAECVGCAKCLSACPVDAILGAPQFLHTVLVNECIGCGLCVAPCPMDCIDIVESSIQEGTPEKRARAYLAKKRYIAKQTRLIKRAVPKLQNHSDNPEEQAHIRSQIALAIERVNQKRNSL